MLTPKKSLRRPSKQLSSLTHFCRFLKKILLGGQEEAGADQEEGLSEALRAENRELKMEIFSMQDELVELEKQVSHSPPPLITK